MRRIEGHARWVTYVVLLAAGGAISADDVAPSGRIFQDSVAVLEPERAPTNAMFDTPLITYSAGAVEAFAPSTMRSIWRQPVPCPYQPRCLLATESSLVFATSFELFAVDNRSGRVAWRLPVTPGRDDADDLVDADRWVRVAPTATALYAIDSQRHFISIDAPSGRIIWRKELEGSIPDRIEVSDSVICCLSQSGAGATINTFALADGAPLNASPTRIDAVDALIATTAGPVIFSTDFAAGLDAQGAGERWRVSLNQPIAQRRFVTRGELAAWVSPDGAIMTLDLRSGALERRITIPSVADAEWIALDEAATYVAVGRPGMIIGVNLATNALAWRHSGREMPFAQPPVVTGAELVVVEREHRTNASAPQGEPLRISRLAFNTGMAPAISATSNIRTRPINQFAGVFVRRDALFVLDGTQLIGYVAPGN
ncbi:MAG TPA: PQQ-binding-like beta-propeller repeat protein [Phycisphaerae bacterium]|nr:PQQ-binding-like beta-propeller repeat protein [Phycisphaerae bacterium]HRW52668.1 PQQ-binding-like beta-propeller repeat protein [Phycisphaerae bacterium]